MPQLDGVWACASLLHVARADSPAILRRIARALRPGGVLYCSFKLGDAERIRGERLFNDMNEMLARKALTEAGFTVAEIWESADTHSGRHHEL